MNDSYSLYYVEFLEKNVKNVNQILAANYIFHLIMCALVRA